MEIFSFNPVINRSEEGIWLLVVTFFETTNSVYFKSDKNKNSTISIPGRLRIPNSLEDGVNDKLKKLLKLKSPNDIELRVQRNTKRGNKIKRNPENPPYQILILLKLKKYLKK